MTPRSLAFAAWFLCAAATAGSFSITPVRIDIPVTRRAASIEVENTGPQAAQLQAERYRWRRDNGGDDELEPSEEFVVSPPIFSLAPGQRQIVRVLLMAPPDPTRETAFRLILQETPLGEPPPNTVATVLRISLPVFITPSGARPDLDWSIRREAGGMKLEVENRGGAHAFITSVKMLDGRNLKADGYLLAGERRSWPIEAPLERIIVTQRDGGAATVAVRAAP